MKPPTKKKSVKKEDKNIFSSPIPPPLNEQGWENSFYYPSIIKINTIIRRIPSPSSNFPFSFGRCQCSCGKTFWSVEKYAEHYIIKHILEL